jgi:hypothetical protein
VFIKDGVLLEKLISVLVLKELAYDDTDSVRHKLEVLTGLV